jgi:superfamily II DNA or RNA helicase
VSTIETWARKGLRLFAVFDEIHHGSESNVWGNAAERLQAVSARSLAMTGTPFRGDGKRIRFVEYNDQGVAIPDHRYSYREAVTQKVCRPVLFMIDDGIAEFIHNGEEQSVRLSEAKADDDAGRASAVIFKKDSEWLQQVITKADAKLDEYRTHDIDAGGIIICRPGVDETDDRYLLQVAKLVRELTGEAPEVITHEDSEANAKIERFRSGAQRWICSVRKISEGVDIKRLRVQVLANRPGTELLFRQLIGRVVRVDDPAKPGDATVFMAKFPQLLRWAEQISNEAEAGLHDAKKRDGGEQTERSENSCFVPIGSTHEDGGAISDFGEAFHPGEITAAERYKSDDPQLAGVSVAQIAHLMRKMGVIPPPVVEHGEPLHLQKKKLRTELNRLARQLAIQRNPYKPDFEAVWSTVFRRTGARNLDDLMDNKPIEVMRQVEEMFKAMLVNSNAAA